MESKIEQIKAELDGMLSVLKKTTQKASLILSDATHLLPYSSLVELPYSTPIEVGEGVTLVKHPSYDSLIHMSCVMAEGSQFGTHQHDFFEYMFITKGEIKEIVSGNVLEQGDLHELRKGGFHGFKALSPVAMKIICSRKRLTKSISRVFSA